MPLYQKIIAKYLYPLDRFRSGDSAENRYLQQYEASQYYHREWHEERTFEALQRLIAHAIKECPYYRTRFQEKNITPGDIHSFDDFASLPILEKRDIQLHRDEMVAESWPRNDLRQNQTGGSTGTPISFYLSRDRQWSQAGATWRHNRWAGYDFGEKIALVWGAPRDIPLNSWKRRLRNLVLDRTLYLDTANITEAKLRSFHDALKKFRPKVIQAYARSLTLLARYIKSHGYQAYQPHSIITSAEALDQSDRVLLEDVFNCPVFNRYGCREFTVVASECEEHQGLHLMAEGLYVEVVRGNRPVAPGEMGELLVTDLLNLAMPMIRYRIGDMGTLDNSPCPCGRGLPRLRNVEGRITDFIVGTDGRLVSGVFLATYVVAQRPSLGQVQLWQNKRDAILYKIARPEGNPVDKVDREYLTTETRKYLGGDMKIEFESVGELKSEPSGKFIFCRSNVVHDFLNSD
jgi:phenylacetate-CoA ligase